MSLVQESEVDCLTIIDHLLPVLMFLSFILGFASLNYLKMRSSEYSNKKLRSIQSGAKIEGSNKDKGI